MRLDESQNVRSICQSNMGDATRCGGEQSLATPSATHRMHGWADSWAGRGRAHTPVHSRIRHRRAGQLVAHRGPAHPGFTRRCSRSSGVPATTLVLPKFRPQNPRIVLPHSLRSLRASATLGKSVWNRRGRPQPRAKLSYPL